MGGQTPYFEGDLLSHPDNNFQAEITIVQTPLYRGPS